MSIEADVPFVSTHGIPPTPGRHISPTEQLGWIFDARPTATVVEIRGDRWTGKSSLLTRLCDEAAGRGWTVAFGSAATQPLRGFPLGLFVDALDDVLARRAPGSADDPDSRPGWPAELFPALCPDEPRPLPPDPFGRYQAFRSVRTLLESLSASGGLLLALDDVHRADEASLALLSYLLRNPAGSRVVLALAHRPRQVDPALRSLLNQAVARGRVHCLTPAALTAEHALARLPHDLSRVQCERILQESGHNPGLLKALGAARSPLVAGGPALPLDVLTESLRDFGELSEAARRVVHAAAVLDEPFDAAALRAVAEVGGEELGRALDELTRDDLLRADGFSARLRFSEPLLRVTAYQSAGLGWLRGAHGRAARLLAGRGADAVRLAGHLEHSPVLGERESARVLVRAARIRLWHDPARTAAWADAALGLELTDEDKAGARLQAGAALTLCGRLKDAIDALAPLSAAPGIPPGLRSDAGHWRALALGLLGARRAAEGELTDALDALGPDDVERRALLLATRLSHALGASGPVPEDLVAPLLTATKRLGPAARGRVFALCAAAAVRSDAGDHAEFQVTAAGRLLDRGADNDIAPHLDGLFWLARAESGLGRRDAARRHLERGLRIVEHRRIRVLAPWFTTALGELDRCSGDLPGAARHAASAEASAATTDSGYLQAAARSFRADLGRLPGPAPAEGLVPGAGPVTAAGSETRARPVPPPSAGGGLTVLSKREMEISVLVSGGRTNQQIARSLAVSHKTVETHLGRIFKKLAVCSRAELAAMVGRSARGAETAH